MIDGKVPLPGPIHTRQKIGGVDGFVKEVAEFSRMKEAIKKQRKPKRGLTRSTSRSFKVPADYWERELIRRTLWLANVRGVPDSRVLEVTDTLPPGTRYRLTLGGRGLRAEPLKEPVKISMRGIAATRAYLGYRLDAIAANEEAEPIWQVENKILTNRKGELPMPHGYARLWPNGVVMHGSQIFPTLDDFVGFAVEFLERNRRRFLIRKCKECTRFFHAEKQPHHKKLGQPRKTCVECERKNKT